MLRLHQRPAKNLNKNYGMLEMMAEVQDPSQIA
ncbi:hypothetical protein CAEBREN_00101 [Caenorhabditis brenneri]|uniref:Uncharacterized protein n=1 Tax=Caenorhabditis brenneri TaxID=135651 RepID=G0MWV2_CAEBE|nr:hypothetical protein CAEBREN_00101 [Caenorhabditis brenneri]